MADTHPEPLAESHLETTTAGHAAETGAPAAETHAKSATEEHASGGANIHISLKPDFIFQLGPLPVTNSLFLSFIILIFLAGIAIIGRRKLALIPGKLQSLFELFLEAALGLMDTILGERSKSEKYLPLVATIFIFVLFSNWFGLLPGVGSFLIGDGHGHNVPLLRSPSADLNFTLGLAIVAVLAINILGAAAIGVRHHVGKFLNFKGPIDFFIGVIEFVSEFARMISFSFRLFGNIFAGEVLLTIVGFLVPYIVPLPFLFLETFVGMVQALIFSMLTLVFIAIATVPHGEGEHAPAHAH